MHIKYHAKPIASSSPFEIMIFLLCLIFHLEQCYNHFEISIRKLQKLFRILFLCHPIGLAPYLNKA
jgi:hypothetical protein